MSASSKPTPPPVADRPIHIKPHHLVDIISDWGAGNPALAPSEYGHALHIITARVLADLNLPVVIEFGADDICAPCRHNRAGHCDDTLDINTRPSVPRLKEDYNLIIDQRWSARLQLRPGDELTVGDFCRRLPCSLDNLRTIYREEPESYVVEKARALTAGINRMLSYSN